MNHLLKLEEFLSFKIVESRVKDVGFFWLYEFWRAAQLKIPNPYERLPECGNFNPLKDYVAMAAKGFQTRTKEEIEQLLHD